MYHFARDHEQFCADLKAVIDGFSWTKSWFIFGMPKGISELKEVLDSPRLSAAEKYHAIRAKTREKVETIWSAPNVARASETLFFYMIVEFFLRTGENCGFFPKIDKKAWLHALNEVREGPMFTGFLLTQLSLMLGPPGRCYSSVDYYSYARYVRREHPNFINEFLRHKTKALLDHNAFATLILMAMAMQYCNDRDMPRNYALIHVFSFDVKNLREMGISEDCISAYFKVLADYRGANVLDEAFHYTETAKPDFKKIETCLEITKARIKMGAEVCNADLKDAEKIRAWAYQLPEGTEDEKAQKAVILGLVRDIKFMRRGADAMLLLRHYLLNDEQRSEDAPQPPHGGAGAASPGAASRPPHGGTGRGLDLD